MDFIVHEVLFDLLFSTGSALWGGQRHDGQAFGCVGALRRSPGQFAPSTPWIGGCDASQSNPPGKEGEAADGLEYNFT